MTVLNPSLVDSCHFTNFGCECKSVLSVLDPEILIKQIEQDLVLKSAKPAKNVYLSTDKSVVDFDMNIFDAAKKSDPMLFDSTKFSAKSFITLYFSNRDTNTFHLSNALLSLVFYILDCHSTTTVISGPLQTCITKMIQLVNKLSNKLDSLFHNPHPELFSTLLERVTKLLTLCEILCDSLVDRSGTILPDASLEFLNDNPIFLSTSRKSMLERYLCLLGVMAMDLDSRIRFLWLQFKIHQLDLNASASVDCLKECATLLKPLQVIKIGFVRRDSIISKAVIDQKLMYYQMQVDIEKTLVLFNEREYQAVYDRLKPIFIFPSDGGEEMISSLEVSKKLEYLNILRQSAFALSKENDWISTLLHTGFVILESIEKGDEDLFINLERFDLILKDLSVFMEGNFTWHESIDEAVFNELRYLILITCQVTWVIVLKWKSVPKTSSTIYAKKIKLFRNLVSKSWLLFYHLINYYQNGAIDGQEDLADILVWVHESIGESGMCCGNEGRLLKTIITHLIPLSQGFHHEIYQCFSCLYGTSFKSSSRQLEDHRSVNKRLFDEEAATLLYRFVKPNLMEKIDDHSYRSIPKDWLDCLQKILDLYPSPDMNDRNTYFDCRIYQYES